MKNNRSVAIDVALTTPRTLDGIWEFAFAGRPDSVDALVKQAVTVGSAGLVWEKVLVPSAFDASLAHAGKRGVGIYRRQFEVVAGHMALLHFGAVSMWSQIYIDGVLLAENACGYEPQEVRVPASDRTVRELVVVVDNRFDFNRVPMHEHYFDFYQYGGILRPVSLRQIASSGVWIDAVRITPTREGYAKGEVVVEVDLCGDGALAKTSLTCGFDNGEPVQASWSEVAEGVCRSGYPVATLRTELRVPDAKLWSPAEPNLHVLHLQLSEAAGAELLEQRAVRFGLRSIESRDGALWLNGERLILQGYNRHEWHPNYGPCTPQAQMFADIMLLKDMGCNFVRGSHYHQDQRFLDLCDELGLLVWEENLGWGQRQKTFESEKFVRDHRKGIFSMVRESFNHPSIIIWGFLNEAVSNDECARAVFEQSAQDLRDLDGSRLISYASMFPDNDLYFGLVDLISVNAYPGWYGCEDVENPIGMIAPRIDTIVRNIDARGLGDKPVLISEIGAEGLYGWRDPHNDFFTETYQANYIKEAIRATQAHPRCCGVALWHFSDARTYSGGRSLGRPRTFNNKGTLDEYRRPKEAYAVVKQAFTAH